MVALRCKHAANTGLDPFPRTHSACSLKLRDYLGFGVDGVVVMFPLKIVRRKTVKGRVAPLRVVPILDPGKDGQACLGPGPPTAPGNEFALQSRTPKSMGWTPPP